MTQNERHELVKDLASVIAGLQVPYSLDKRMLGTAAEAWIRVWNRMHFGGWLDEDSIAVALEQFLLDE